MIIALLLAVGAAVLWRASSTEQHGKQSAAVTPPQPGAVAELPAVPPRSIAGLPFVNMSSEKEQEYFSDGLSEELFTLLSKVPELRVAARTSSFYFKGKDVKLPEIARELQVAHVLEGSVRKSGNRVKITAQLIRASDGYHQWSETYDRTLADIFAVQEEIAKAVVSQLKVTLLTAPPKVYKTSPEAYALYLRAKQLDREGTGQYDEAIALYQKALEIDPGYAPAWLWLSEKYGAKAIMGLMPLDEGMKLGRQALGKVLAIDPDNAAAHAALGWMALYHDRDLAASARHLEHALALDPADRVALDNGLQLNEALGRLDESVELTEYFVSLDPMDPRNHALLGNAYLDAGRLDDAMGSYRAALNLAPDGHGQHADIARVLLLKGQYEAAIVEFKKEVLEPVRLGGLARAYYALDQTQASDAARNELIKKYPNWSVLIASLYANRREIDRAFEWLQVAVKINDSDLAGVPWATGLKILHDDPPWLPFLRKIGKAPEQLAAIQFELKVPTH